MLVVIALCWSYVVRSEVCQSSNCLYCCQFLTSSILLSSTFLLVAIFSQVSSDFGKNPFPWPEKLDIRKTGRCSWAATSVDSLCASLATTMRGAKATSAVLNATVATNVTKDVLKSLETKRIVQMQMILMMKLRLRFIKKLLMHVPILIARKAIIIHNSGIQTDQLFLLSQEVLLARI